MTVAVTLSRARGSYFNPHEREARDFTFGVITACLIQILIHTSVKLVTPLRIPRGQRVFHFNPHEREARDRSTISSCFVVVDFNPHEREARDAPKPTTNLYTVPF